MPVPEPLIVMVKDFIMLSGSSQISFTLAVVNLHPPWFFHCLTQCTKVIRITGSTNQVCFGTLRWPISPPEKLFFKKILQDLFPLLL